MTKYQKSLEKTRTNLIATIVVILLLIIGVIFYFAANWAETHTYSTLSGVMKTLAGTFFAISVLSIIWELYLRRSFAAEVLSAANVSADVRDAGLDKIEYDNTHILWDELFKNATELDLLFAYGSSWRGTHENRLKKIVERCCGRARVFLPDPDNLPVVNELSARFGKNVTTIQEKIKTAITDFRAMGFRVFLLSIAPTYSAYRFGNALVIAIYSHTREKASVPHFVCSRGGRLYEFVNAQLTELAKPDRGISKELDDYRPENRRGQ